MRAIAVAAAGIVLAGVISGASRAHGEAAPQASQTSICLMLESAARTYDIPVEFFARIIWQESSFNPEARGPKTRSGSRAEGIAQFMPGTAAERNLLDPFDPIQALPKAAEFLDELRRRFGNLGLAAAAYNAGPRRLSDWLAGVGSMPAETRNYVYAVTGYSIEDWRSESTQFNAKPASFNCDQMIASVKQPPNTFVASLEGRVKQEATQPWSVQLSAGFSRDKALTKYAQSMNRFANLLADRDPVIGSLVLRSRGTRPFYQVRVGAQTRSEADALCARIRAAAGACMVLRSHGLRQNPAT
jgi:hypothetical protein